MNAARKTPKKDERNALGVALEQAAHRLGLSGRQAAMRAKISPTSWVNLTRGYQVLGDGITRPVKPRPDTVAKVARALGMDVEETLKLIGHTMSDIPQVRDLSDIPTAELAAELNRRLNPEK